MVGLPSREAIANAEDAQLRSIAQDLVATVAESRLSAAHYKLQNSLLAMGSAESAKRAEVEHQMTRREVEFLHSNHSYRYAASGTLDTSLISEVESLQRRLESLESANSILASRLRKAKKVIEEEKANSISLAEENVRLKARIRENREYYNRLRNHLPSSTARTDLTSPRAVAQRTDTSTHRLQTRKATNQDFASQLLAAAHQVHHGEATSVPSTPANGGAVRSRAGGHTRGALSMSSVPSTPQREGGPRASAAFFTPVNEPSRQATLGFGRGTGSVSNSGGVTVTDDRDSTLSASDLDDGGRSPEVEDSPATLRASNMLKRYVGRSEPQLQNASRSSVLLQTKLFGSVKKPGVHLPPPVSAKRHTDDGSHGHRSAKKPRHEENLGLGIQNLGASAPSAS